MSHRIAEFYAFVVVDENDEEGLCAFLNPATRTWVPMVASDKIRLDGLRQAAQNIATETGQEITVLKFTVREEVETIHPKGD